jgi:multidrug resistance protein, MATE family
MNSPEAPRPATLKALLTLAWPIIISRSSQVVVGLSDALLVAHLGKAALAATATGAFNAFALLILPMGIVFIVSSYASQLYGKGDLVGARRYGFYGLWIAVAAQVISLGGVAIAPWVLAQLGYDEDVRTLMTGYLALRMLSGGAAIGIEALSNYYGGLGRTRLPMIASVVAMVLNVALNWVLIDGHLGAPAMGVRGSALASTIATSFAFVGLLAWFLYEGKAAGAIVPKLKWSEFAQLLRFGVPSGLNWFFEFFAFNFFINVVVVGLGTSALAAMNSVLNINSVSFMPAFGVSSAGAILVGQSIGAGQKDRVQGLVWLTFKTNAAWQGLVGLIYLAVPGLLLAPFKSDEADAQQMMEIGVRMLMLSAAWQLFDAAVSTVAEALRAAGDTAYTLWARLIISWALFVPGSYVTVRVMGGNDLVAMAWVVGYLAVLAGVLTLRFRGGAWKKLELVDPLAGTA